MNMVEFDGFGMPAPGVRDHHGFVFFSLSPVLESSTIPSFLNSYTGRPFLFLFLSFFLFFLFLFSLLTAKAGSYA